MLSPPSWRGRAFALIAIFSSHAAIINSAHAEPTEIWTPETSVDLRYESYRFDHPDDWPAMGTQGKTAAEAEPALFSPDKRHFITISYSAKLADDMEIAELKLYESDAVKRALQRGGGTSALPPRREYRFTSNGPHRAMSDVRWDEDSRNILFNGADRYGKAHIYRIDVKTGDVEIIESLPEKGALPVFAYRGGASATFEFKFVGPERYEYPANWIGRKEGKPPLITNSVWELQNQTRTSLRTAGRCNGAPPVPLQGVRPFNIAIAPAGCMAVIEENREYRLLNLRTGEASYLASASVGSGGVWWSDDGRRVALSCIVSDRQKESVEAAVYDVATKSLERLGEVRPDSANCELRARWIAPDAFVMGPANGGDTASRVDLRSGSWRKSAVPISMLIGQGYDPGFDVVAEQDLNTPAVIVARNGANRQVLTMPDTLLDTVKRGKWQKFTWDEAGLTHEGGIMMPTAGHRGDDPPPVVFTPYYYTKHSTLFQPDGPHKGADSSAQALAARGFAVVWFDAFKHLSLAQEEIAKTMPGGVYPEGKLFVDRMDLVIDELSGRGLIDPTRIGLAGFSRGGYLSIYHATHPGRHPVSAYIWVDGGWGMAVADMWDHLNNFRGYVPYAGNYYANRERRQEMDTLEHVDKVGAPMLFTQNGSKQPDRSALFQILLSGFYEAKRPFDLIEFRQGEHQLRRPRERFVLMSSIVDWFAFWIKGERPSDPDRAQVWEKLREDGNKQKAWEAAGNPAGSAPIADQ